MEKITPLLSIIRRLRGRDGCQWDQQQTPLSMWKCLAEEVYELEEGIVNDDLENVIEELGDVLFQVLFILEIYTESKRFDFTQVIDSAAEKMIRRHPHIYGKAVVNTEDELHRQWERIKAGEKKGRGKQGGSSALDSVPRGMPGLVRALKVSKCAVKEGFEWEDMTQVLDTVKDEIHEFEMALEKGDRDETILEFGDILFSLVNVARFAGFHPETALAGSTAKFERRFRLMEADLKKKGLSLKEMTPREKETHWQRAKLACSRGDQAK